MKQEITVTGKTVEAAILAGAEQLGVDRSLVTFEVLEMPKKGFLGFGEIPAKVKVCYEAGIESVAFEFVTTLMKNMGINADVRVSDQPGNTKLVKIETEDNGAVIGRGGETLDAIQYLTNLAVNKADEDDEEESELSKKERATRIIVNVGNYREKREETLRSLARKKAQVVLKYHKTIALEPMNPHERKIIHSEIQGIEGVSTISVGYDNERKILIYPEGTSPFRPKQGKKKNAPAEADVKADTTENTVEVSEAKAENSESKPPKRRRKPYYKKRKKPQGDGVATAESAERPENAAEE